MTLVDAALTLLLKFFSMLALVLLPIKPMMIAVSVLVVADFFTGIYAAKKEKKPITSTGFKKTVAKTLMYQMAIIVAFILETYLLEGIPIVKVVAGLIGLTEGKSFFENMHRITGIDFWAEALKKVHGATVKDMPEDERK